MVRKSTKNLKKVEEKKYPNYQHTTWVFTLNNYTFEEMLGLQELTFPSNDRIIASIAFSEEVGGRKATPHLQGFLQTYKKGKKFYV